VHFDFTITLGSLFTFVGIVGGIWRIEKLRLTFFIEHEILIREYCKRNNINLNDLPTRVK
jgi:hypothetical protein